MKGNQLNFNAANNRLIFQLDENLKLQTLLHTHLPIDDDKEFEFTIKHSKHSRKRASQRSFNYKVLLMVLLIGMPFYRQGMTFYTVLGKDIPANLCHRMAEKIRNVVVVLGDDGYQIVTCYHASNAVKYLKRKGKELKR